MYESNKISHFVFKYGVLCSGIIFLASPLSLLIDPSSNVIINGEEQPATFLNVLPFFVLSMIQILVGLIFYRNMRMVQLSKQRIIILDGKERIEHSWIDVKRVKMFRFVYPPLYSIRISGSSSSYWFVSEYTFFSIPLLRLDTSEMGTAIAHIKKSYRV